MSPTRSSGACDLSQSTEIASSAEQKGEYRSYSHLPQEIKDKIFSYTFADDFEDGEASPSPDCQSSLLEKHVVYDSTAQGYHQFSLWCHLIFKRVCQVSKFFLQDAMPTCTKAGWLEIGGSVEHLQPDPDPKSRSSPVKVGLLKLMSAIQGVKVNTT